MPATMPARRTAQLAVALLSLLVAVAPVRATGVPAFTVVDLYPGPTDSWAFDTSNAVTLDGWVYFAATDNTYGRELRRAKVGDSGLEVELVKDIVPGTGGSGVNDLVAIGDYIYFRAFDDTNGYELWRTNGTAAGTTLIKDIRPGTDSSNPTNFVDQGDWILFVADDGTNGTELWRTDGTADGTTMVKNIAAGAVSSNAFDLVAVGDLVFFAANDNVNGTELWRSDGTETGTIIASNISEHGDANPQGLISYNGALYFSADDDTNGRELWRADGATTTMVKDINAGPDTSYPIFFTEFGGKLYFRAQSAATGGELWVTDGTEGGTHLVKDINPEGSSLPWGFVVHGSHLYFDALDNLHGQELWRTDGTEEGTQIVQDYASGTDSSYPWPLVSLGDYLYYSAYDYAEGGSYQVFRTDGTNIEEVPFPRGTSQRLDCDCYPTNMVGAGPTLFTTVYSSEADHEIGHEFAYLTEPTADLPSTDRNGAVARDAFALLALATTVAGITLRLAGRRSIRSGINQQ